MVHVHGACAWRMCMVHVRGRALGEVVYKRASSLWIRETTALLDRHWALRVRVLRVRVRRRVHLSLQPGASECDIITQSAPSVIPIMLNHH